MLPLYARADTTPCLVPTHLLSLTEEDQKNNADFKKDAKSGNLLEKNDVFCKKRVERGSLEFFTVMPFSEGGRNA